MSTAVIPPVPGTPDTRHPVLEELFSRSPDFVGAVLVARDGTVMGVAGEQEALLLKLAPFAVGAFELIARTVDEAGQGDIGAVLVESADGHIGLHPVGDDGVLFALVRDGVALGVLRHDLGRAAKLMSAHTH